MKLLKLINNTIGIVTLLKIFNWEVAMLRNVRKTAVFSVASNKKATSNTKWHIGTLTNLSAQHWEDNGLSNKRVIRQKTPIVAGNTLCTTF